MKTFRRAATIALGLVASLAALSPRTEAMDIDIYTGTSGTNADVPNVIFLVDNTDNWSRAAQHWPGGGVQGAAELNAISNVLNSVTAAMPVNVGFSLLTSYSGSSAGGATPGVGGGYIRFGTRDMSNATNRTALQNILAYLAANVTNPAEKLTGQSSKDEGAAFYELYKYLSGLHPFTGPSGAGYAAQNAHVDVPGNPDSESAAGQGLTSGFALVNGVYQTPISSTKPCARTYIIYVANNTSTSPSAGQYAYQPRVVNTAPDLLPVTFPGDSNPHGFDSTLDEWTKYLYTHGVIVPEGNNNGSVVSYVLDAYNAMNDPGYSSNLKAAAKRGGGKYYQVGSSNAIASALKQIFSEIQAVNSTFASASLPANTTNRALDRNEVFIPMFRPDPLSNPLWLGNLKRYEVISLNGTTTLGDSSSPPLDAVDSLTGFLTPCAMSFWTTDSGTYWYTVPENPAAQGLCSASSYSPWSDAPDGPFVEKGGVAEVLRKGNNPPTTNTTPTWAVNRTVYTLSGLSGASLVPFTAATTGLPSALVNWVLGQDYWDENNDGISTDTRPSLHADEIHSRPLAVDYGSVGCALSGTTDTTCVTVYYGSNDGTLRAVDSTTGRERWAFIPPEFYTPAPVMPPGTPTGLARLMYSGNFYPGDANADPASPVITFPGQPAGITPAPQPKDFYFDGSIGVYDAANNASVWIYPSMRRGGREIYALDVTAPGSPRFMWKAGCPYLTIDTGCSAGMSGLGQTWSTPLPAAKINGYASPVVVVGGGYDACEDANNSSPTCAGEKGVAVYVLDAASGAVIATFNTLRAVAADVALVSYANTGVIDHAYAVDTGGNLYRIDFGSSIGSWTISLVAYTHGAGRKFLFAPALVPGPNNQIYVAVGSGDREHPLQSQYPYGGVLNRFYVYRDTLSFTNTSLSVGSAHSLDDTSLMYNYTTMSTAQGTVYNESCSTPQVLPGSDKLGWFMDLDGNGAVGEQAVTSAVVAGGLVYFSTNRPIPASQGTCSTSLGEARGYVVNLFNSSGAIGVAGACGGARYGIFTGGGLPPSPVLATLPVPVIGKSTTQVETVVIGGMDRAQGVTGDGSPPATPPSSCTGCTGSPIGPTLVTLPFVPARKQVYWKSTGEN